LSVIRIGRAGLIFMDFSKRQPVFSGIHPIGLNHKNFIINPGNPACQAIARQGLFWYERNCCNLHFQTPLNKAGS